MPLRVERGRVEVAPRDHHHPFALAGHAVVLVEGEVAVLVGDRLHLTVGEPEEAAPRDQHVRGALHEAADDGRPFSSFISWKVAMNL